MSTLTTIASSDVIANSRTDINNNFSALNTDKIETSVIDTDTTLAANSDSKIPSQKAVKAYVDSGGNPNASTTVRGLVEEATQAELTAGTTSGGTGARLFLNPTHTVSISAGSSDEGKIPRLNSSGQLDSTIVTSSFPVQDIGILAGTGAIRSIYSGSNTTGTVLFVVYDLSSTTATILRYAKDVTTGNYYQTHTTTLSISSSGTRGICVVGSYVYVGAVIGGNSSITRYAIADLTGVTSMTGVTAGTIDGGMWSDGTNIFCFDGSNSFNKYTISGTALTDAGAVGFTSSGNPVIASASNGTNVWVSDTTGATTYTIRKYAVAGGAVVSTTTFNLNKDMWLDASGWDAQLFIAGTGMLGIIFLFHFTSNSAVISSAAHLIAISQP